MRTARLFLGGSFTRALGEMERAQWLSPGELDERANARLGELLEHARTTVPFYRKRVSLQTRPSAATARTDLAAFPVVTKADLRAAGIGELASEDVPGERRVLRSTSGSTGEPFRFFLDSRALPLIFASHVFYDRWSGLAVGERYVRIVAPINVPSSSSLEPARRQLHQAIIGRLQKAYERRTQRQIWHADIDGIAAEHLRSAIDSFRPAFVLGYASALAALSAELGEADRPLKRSLRGVITIAELLTPERRCLIERYFAAPITNRYGLREFGWWAGQDCSRSAERLHLNSELVVAEVLTSDSTPANVGEVGRLVLTDLHNRAVPLIRYDTGDLAVAESESCSCGRGFPLVTIEGRSLETVPRPSGELVTPRRLAVAVSRWLDPVSQIQLVREAGDSVRLVVATRSRIADQTRSRLEQVVREAAGYGSRVSVETALQISPEPSGKRPIVKLNGV
jgi:phenylacetate-CoA ligase